MRALDYLLGAEKASPASAPATMELASHTCSEPLLERDDNNAASETSQPLLSKLKQPPARPSLLGTDELTSTQARLDERIRTLSLVILATAIVGIGLYYLRTILIRFVLALALRYLLTPLIDVLSCEHVASSRLRLPRAVATLLALCVAVGVLFTMGLIVARSVSNFAAHSRSYQHRIEVLLTMLVDLIARLGMQDELPLSSNISDVSAAVADLVQHRLHLSSLIVEALGKAGEILENTIYILLFLAFLLVGSSTPRKPGADRRNPPRNLRSPAETQIFLYIRGKAAVALLVALLDGAIYWSLHLELWLVFGVLTFWLSFIPNIGMAVSVCLPLPVVVLDPNFSAWGMAIAFCGPVAIGTVAKDVVEPLLIGHSTSLTPVAVLLAVMIWGSMWGVSGMVLAVPMTAVGRLYLENLDHPLPRYIAAVLSGRDHHDEEEEARSEPGSRRLRTRVSPQDSEELRAAEE